MNVIKIYEHHQLSKKELRNVSRVLKKGGVVVVPTDTSYGLAALVNNPKAVRRVFDLKGRAASKTSSMVVKSQKQALKYVTLTSGAKRLWSAFLPGPLTIVLPVKAKLNKYLVQNKGAAIRRVPVVALNQLLNTLTAPLTITSANRSGKPDIYNLETFMKQYNGKKKPDIFLDIGELKKNKPSTVISLLDEPVILREGPISKKQILKVLT